MKADEKKIAPDFLKKHKESMVRKHRQVIYLNDYEIDAVERYCERFKLSSKGAVLREIIIKKIFEDLEGNHPTLF